VIEFNAHPYRGAHRGFNQQMKGVFMSTEDELIVWSFTLDGK
jgi:hypothetical protein